MKTFKSIYFSALLATVFAGCSQHEDIVSSENGEYKLMVGAQLYNQPVSRTTAEDGVTFDYSAQITEYPFTLSLNDVAKEMNLSLAEGTSSISYKNPEDEFSVEIVEYNVSVSGEMFNKMPLALNKTFDEHQYSFNFPSSITLAENKLTPVKDVNSARLSLPLKVDAAGLMIDFTLYSISPKAISPIIGGNTEEIVLAEGGVTSGSLFYKTGTEGLASYYTVLIPFTEKTGTIAAGTTVATLSALGQTYKINLPADKAIDLSSGKLYTMSVMENLEANLETVSCTINDWGVDNFTSAVVGKDFDIVEGVYHIYSEAGLEEWRKVAATVETANTSAKLMNDIVLTKNWPSLGNKYGSDKTTAHFNGTFDGNGHTISNVNISLNSWVNTGFIASLGSEGSVKNLTLRIEGVKTVSNGQCVGGLVGYALSGSEINNCKVIIEDGAQIIANDETSYSGYYAGGIIGKNGGATIKNCTVVSLETGYDVAIYSKHGSGGIAGTAIDSKESQTVIENCHVDVKSILATSGAAGGIVGELKSKYDFIACSVDCDDVESNASKGAGGIIGHINDGAAITNVYACYFNGSVESTANKPIGGVIGQGQGTLKITSSYSIATLSGGGSKGGIIGYSSPAATVTSCYTTSEQAGSGIKVDTIGEEQQASMNGALTDSKVNWQYVASDSNPFPLVIQSK